MSEFKIGDLVHHHDNEEDIGFIVAIKDRKICRAPRAPSDMYSYSVYFFGYKELESGLDWYTGNDIVKISK